MPGCSAISCSNRSEQGFKLKVFPRDPHQRAIWKDKVRRANWSPTNSSYLCEVHFDEDQWEKTTSDGKRKLKRGAIPTLFEYCKAQTKRKLPRERLHQEKVVKGDEIVHKFEEHNDKDRHIESLSESLKKLQDMNFLLQQRNKALKRRVTSMSLKYCILKAKFSRTKQKLIYLVNEN